MVWQQAQRWTHVGAVGGVLKRLDDFELIHHLTHHHDAGPHTGYTGGEGAESGHGQSQTPQHQEQEVHQGHLEHTDTLLVAADMHLVK